MRISWMVGAVCLLFALSSLMAAGTTPAYANQPLKAAVFDFELIDNSLEGEKRGVDPTETARLGLISNLLRELLEKSGKYDLVPLTSVAKEIENAGYIHGCNGCDASFAKKVGANLSITGQVFKMSTLILNIKIFIRDADSGALVRAVNADIRGNTDASWMHGVRWLVRHRLLAD